MNRLSFKSLLLQNYQKIFFMSIGQEFIILRSLEVEVLTKKAITYGSRISLWMVTQELSSWFLYWKSSKSSPAYVYGCKIWLRCRMVFSFVLGGRYDLKEAHKYTWLVSETNKTVFAVIKAKGNVHQSHLFESFKRIWVKFAWGRAFKTKKLLLTHVWDSKIWLGCRVILPFLSSIRYGHMYVTWP